MRVRRCVIACCRTRRASAERSWTLAVEDHEISLEQILLSSGEIEEALSHCLKRQSRFDEQLIPGELFDECRLASEERGYGKLDHIRQT